MFVPDMKKSLSGFGKEVAAPFPKKMFVSYVFLRSGQVNLFFRRCKRYASS
jgi:hypothetical protein